MLQEAGREAYDTYDKVCNPPRACSKQTALLFLLHHCCLSCFPPTSFPPPTLTFLRCSLEQKRQAHQDALDKLAKDIDVTSRALEKKELVRLPLLLL